MRDPTRSCPALLVLLSTLLAAPPDARAAIPPAPRSAQEEPPAVPPPALSTPETARLERTLKKLVSTKTAARRAAEDEVIAFGRGALPLLEEEAATDHPQKQQAVLRCLLEIANENDEVLVLRCFSSEHVVLRRFAAAKAGALGSSPLVARLAPLLEDPDALVRNEAALSLAQRGQQAALAPLARAWIDSLPPADPNRKRAPSAADESAGEELRRRIAEALPGLSGQGDHQAVAQLLGRDPVREKEQPAQAAAERRAAVAMLAALGDAAAVTLLARALDDPHNLVQRDAIDALRRILENQPPFAGGSIFQQVNEVERLKALLTARR